MGGRWYLIMKLILQDHYQHKLMRLGADHSLINYTWYLLNEASVILDQLSFLKQRLQSEIHGAVVFLISLGHSWSTEEFNMNCLTENTSVATDEPPEPISPFHHLDDPESHSNECLADTLADEQRLQS